MTGADRAAALAAAATGITAELADAVGRAGRVVGIGIDAVDLDRFAGTLRRRHRLCDRLFTGGELAYARAAVDPVPRLSTRFAAKEATMKSLGVGLGAFAFHDVEVVREGLGAPRLVLHGAAEDLAAAAGVVRWHLALTHTDQVALAVVVAEGAEARAPAADPPVLAADPPVLAADPPVLAHPPATP